MKPKGYIVFHLNLAFSSIEEEARSDVVRTCYHALLDLIETAEIPIGIELTGWTLRQIKKIDTSWIERFKVLIDSGNCELIGSGYCQIIGPLAPYLVNEWNQKLGLDTYQEVLNCRPEVVLVNEMAFSSSMVDLYSQFGYKGFIMDRDNAKLSLGSDKVPTHAKGAGNSIMPILWSDSILFQKVQHFAHGDISINDYLSYLAKRINNSEFIFPIYCNDAEVFDYRPGRFSEERPTHHEGEWKRVERLFNSITSKTEIEIVLPTQALKISSGVKDRFVSKLASAAHPIPVKKQAKYNIARWAVTGRDDFWLNTMCHRIGEYFLKHKNNNHDDWIELCELWSSDLRTHITDKRWNGAKKQLNILLHKYNISSCLGPRENSYKDYKSLKSAVGQYQNMSISLDSENILLCISTKYLELKLNLRRGLAIQELAFASHEMTPCIGTLPHGYFECISLGADYYSGNTVVEMPLLRRRVTDLERVEPKFLIKENGNIEIYSTIETQFGNIVKVIEVSTESEKVSLSYSFLKWSKMTGSVRLGVITFLNQFSDENTKLLCANGGRDSEIFDFNGEFNHTKPASTLVSSSGGLGATTGKIQIVNSEKSINLQWDPSVCSVMPMLSNTLSSKDALSRVFFSMQELDDTAKGASNPNRFFMLDIST